MDDKSNLAPSHLGSGKAEPVGWDWWSENPAEIILVVFILIFFFLLPRDGCGISQQEVSAPEAPAQTGQP